MSEDGITVTLPPALWRKWTNGDPVTAGDFEYSWKRTLSPELAADYAYQLYGIKGAAEYNGCEKNCDALADKVGVTAVDDKTLEVTLTSAQPWFIQQSAHHSFLAVHQATVEQFGTSGPSRRTSSRTARSCSSRGSTRATINLVKNPDWRGADCVSARRGSTGRSSSTERRGAGLRGRRGRRPRRRRPASGRDRPTEGDARVRAVPRAGDLLLRGQHRRTSADVHERRALSLAVNRQEIIDQVAQADQIPATGMSPEGIPGFDTINPNSPWTPEGDIEQARA